MEETKEKAVPDKIIRIINNLYKTNINYMIINNQKASKTDMRRTVRQRAQHYSKIVNIHLLQCL